MNIGDIMEFIRVASALRMPKLNPNDNPSFKISSLEEYMLQVAYHRGDLEEAIGWVLEAKHEAKRTLDGLIGWEMHVRGERTQENVLTAKGKISPEAVAVIRDADYYLKRLDRQVRRLEHDHDAISRAYTLIVGGG